MDCRVHGVTKNQTQLSDFHYYNVNTTLYEKEPEIFQQGNLAGVVEQWHFIITTSFYLFIIKKKKNLFRLKISRS